MRERRGCVGETPDPIFEYAGKNYNQCPGRVITESTSWFLSNFGMCLKFRRFPLAGGLIEQTHSFVTAAGVVLQIVNEVERENVLERVKSVKESKQKGK